MIVRTQVPLAPLTALRLGGSGARMVDVTREDDLVEALSECEARREPVFVLGGGSNVVVADEGFPGLVVRMAMRGIRADDDGERVRVDVAAGEEWDALVGGAVEEGWCGIACMSGIPGLVGATPIQNVGAYGEEVSGTVTDVRVFDREAKAFSDLPAEVCAFGYRASRFKRNDRFVVTRVRFAFAKGTESRVRYSELARALGIGEGHAAPMRAVRETVIALRRGKGMVVDPSDPESVSAGSFFVNPIVDARTVAEVEARAGAKPPAFEVEEGVGDRRWKIAAAWLVERAGFAKGWTHGGAGRVGVSRKHALALVNRGGATAGELLAAARAIRDGVHARFGVTLEPEPVFVGCSWEELLPTPSLLASDG